MGKGFGICLVFLGALFMIVMLALIGFVVLEGMNNPQVQILWGNVFLLVLLIIGIGLVCLIPGILKIKKNK